MYVYAKIPNFTISNVVLVLEMLTSKMFSLFHWTAKKLIFWYIDLIQSFDTFLKAIVSVCENQVM